MPLIWPAESWMRREVDDLMVAMKVKVSEEFIGVVMARDWLPGIRSCGVVSGVREYGGRTYKDGNGLDGTGVA
jgi:hypothetical protein